MRSCQLKTKEELEVIRARWERIIERLALIRVSGRGPYMFIDNTPYGFAVNLRFILADNIVIACYEVAN